MIQQLTRGVRGWRFYRSMDEVPKTKVFAKSLPKRTRSFEDTQLEEDNNPHIRLYKHVVDALERSFGFMPVVARVEALEDGHVKYNDARTMIARKSRILWVARPEETKEAFDRFALWVGQQGCRVLLRASDTVRQFFETADAGSVLRVAAVEHMRLAMEREGPVAKDFMQAMLRVVEVDDALDGPSQRAWRALNAFGTAALTGSFGDYHAQRRAHRWAGKELKRLLKEVGRRVRTKEFS